MDVSRGRFESLVEWAVAVVFITAILAAGSLLVHEFRSVNPVAPVIARETTPPTVGLAGAPARAVSVPLLLLADGKEVHMGDSLSVVAARLGRQAETGPQSVERAPNGDRLIRYYEHAGSMFILVFEPFEQNGESRVAAIYLH